MWSSTRRQLARHALDLVLGEAKAGEARDVQDLVAVDHVRMLVVHRAASPKERPLARARGPQRLLVKLLSLLRRA